MLSNLEITERKILENFGKFPKIESEYILKEGFHTSAHVSNQNTFVRFLSMQSF